MTLIFTLSAPDIDIDIEKSTLDESSLRGTLHAYTILLQTYYATFNIRHLSIPCDAAASIAISVMIQHTVHTHVQSLKLTSLGGSEGIDNNTNDASDDLLRIMLFICLSQSHAHHILTQHYPGHQ